MSEEEDRIRELDELIARHSPMGKSAEVIRMKRWQWRLLQESRRPSFTPVFDVPGEIGFKWTDSSGKPQSMFISPEYITREINCEKEVQLRSSLEERFAEINRQNEERRRLEKEAARKKVARKADVKAKALLYRYLTREQKWDLRASGKFNVVGQNGVLYEIRSHYGQNVSSIVDGAERIRYCTIAHVEIVRLPIPDLLLSQKLLLENDIESFFAKAYSRNMIMWPDHNFNEGEDPEIEPPPTKTFGIEDIGIGGPLDCYGITEEDSKDILSWARAQLEKINANDRWCRRDDGDDEEKNRNAGVEGCAL